MTIPKSNWWGPFSPDLDPCERRARLRSLRAIARLHLGPRGAALSTALDAAETDEGHLPKALTALDRRRVLASCAAFTAPAAA